MNNKVSLFKGTHALINRPFTLAAIAAVMCPLVASATDSRGPASPALKAVMEQAPLRIPYEQTLSLHGISFRVQGDNIGDTGKVRITPEGLTVDNSIQERPINGRVAGAEVADLNADGSPEVYVFIRGNGPTAPGELVAMSVNRGKSLTDIALPTLTPRQAKGYRGHDQFAVLENVLGRRFPVFASDAPDAHPVKVRQIQYRLRKGEATWKLVVDKVIEF